MIWVTLKLPQNACRLFASYFVRVNMSQINSWFAKIFIKIYKNIILIWSPLDSMIFLHMPNFFSHSLESVSYSVSKLYIELQIFTAFNF